MPVIVGRSSSHFTRVARIFAEALEVPYVLAPVHDLTATAADVFAGNPALKVPVLRRDDGRVLLGTENICRALAELAARDKGIVWPEDLRDDLSRNAQELAWHGMNAQVQLVLGTLVAKLPADNVYFAKARAGFEGALRFLDDHVDDVVAALPERRDLSFFEVTLFCLVEHIAWRKTLPLESYPALVRFAAAFGTGDAAARTAYAFDAPP